MKTNTESAGRIVVVPVAQMERAARDLAAELGGKCISRRGYHAIPSGEHAGTLVPAIDVQPTDSTSTAFGGQLGTVYGY